LRGSGKYEEEWIGGKPRKKKTTTSEEEKRSPCEEGYKERGRCSILGKCRGKKKKQRKIRETGFCYYGPEGVEIWVSRVKGRK